MIYACIHSMLTGTYKCTHLYKTSELNLTQHVMEIFGVNGRTCGQTLHDIQLSTRSPRCHIFYIHPFIPLLHFFLLMIILIVRFYTTESNVPSLCSMKLNVEASLLNNLDERRSSSN